GADGYVLKEATYAELYSAIRSVASGKTYVSRAISERMAGLLPGETRMESGGWDSLTHRERQVLKLVAEGRANKEIADFLFLSVKTVEKHRAKLMHKLGVQKVAGLTAYAIGRGLVVN
ncbi:MAG: response regulator transcription factor, partial [Gammaproteobacteria bacterium]|nr:response regulator transcription factor [Gammaproteobacteria bacterium]